MTAALGPAVALGLLLGAGSWLVMVRLPFMRKPTFQDRVEPQLRAHNLHSRLLRPIGRDVAPFGPLERILRPVVREGLGLLARFDPGGTALARKLARAGAAKSVVDFRAEQLLWAAGGVLLAVLGVLASAVSGRFLPLAALIAVAGSAAGGYLLRSFVLDLRIKRREAAFLAEFPGVAELLALAVAAGESALNAMERICRTSNGELAKEFAEVLADARSGKPFTEALQAFSARTEVPAVVRFVDGLVVAVDRGTPLAEVLRAQAADVRDAAKRELMESAGRKEIGMMVPLVFGVLPLTVIFAAFPAVVALDISL